MFILEDLTLELLELSNELPDDRLVLVIELSVAIRLDAEDTVEVEFLEPDRL